ncbi:GIY-YIG nuclease family protein [Pelagibacterales bacterium SAG-MED16]|nr:GIY-YIG nuclease family protein [Pelagibacterales bacterium SAG-MED16]|tara:strand:- start:310 stop:591 length:282 start_codon:yes stop_codon:yes gene_type:complete
MIYCVYLILSKKIDKYRSYVGYTNNISNRLYLHNNSKGAKFTRGREWKIVYLKKYKSKITAMKEEYKLKKNYKLRKELISEYKKNENFNTFTL